MRFIRPLLLSFFALAACTPWLNAQPTPSEAPKARLESGVFELEKLPATSSEKGSRRDVCNNPTKTLERLECHISTLNPGLESHPPHRHPQEEFIILKEGTLDVSINGKSQRVGAGSLFFFASNDLHNVKNVGSEPATYLVFNVATAATKSAPLEGAAKKGAAGILGSTIFEWEKLTPKKNEVGMRRELTQTPTTTCTELEGHITTLNPKISSHAPHHHPDEELLIIKEGRVDVSINGVVHNVGPGAICFFSSNDVHGATNPTDTPVTYYAIRITTAATPKADLK